MRRLSVAVSVMGFVACGKVGGISIDGGANPDGAPAAPIDAAPPFLSCYGLAATCGSGGNDSCCSLDWYAPYATPCMDCANLTTASNRVIRGGSFESSAASARAVYRDVGFPPTTRSGNIGFRCARKS